MAQNCVRIAPEFRARIAHLGGAALLGADEPKLAVVLHRHHHAALARQPAAALEHLHLARALAAAAVVGGEHKLHKVAGVERVALADVAALERDALGRRALGRRVADPPAEALAVRRALDDALGARRRRQRAGLEQLDAHRRAAAVAPAVDLEVHLVADAQLVAPQHRAEVEVELRRQIGRVHRLDEAERLLDRRDVAAHLARPRRARPAAAAAAAVAVAVVVAAAAPVVAAVVEAATVAAAAAVVAKPAAVSAKAAAVAAAAAAVAEAAAVATAVPTATAPVSAAAAVVAAAVAAAAAVVPAPGHIASDARCRRRHVAPRPSGSWMWGGKWGLSKKGRPEKEAVLRSPRQPPRPRPLRRQGPRASRVALVKFSDPSRVSREISNPEIKSREYAHDPRDPSYRGQPRESFVLCVSSPRCRF